MVRKKFINFKLRRKLIEECDELFAILLKKKRLKEAKKISLGLRYHQCVFFMRKILRMYKKIYNTLHPNVKIIHSVSNQMTDVKKRVAIFTF